VRIAIVRGLLVGIAILCLALAIAAAAAWPRSYRHYQLAAIRALPNALLAASATEGTLAVGVGVDIGFEGRWLIYESFPLTLDAADPHTWWDGFEVSLSGPDRYVQAPTPVAILALLGVAAIAWHLARRLRASPERCPECGSPSARSV
jgi:hypothetical protein